MESAPINYANKRIAALDFGMARIGMAVCDEFHISVNTRGVIPNNNQMWETLLKCIQTDRIDVIVVGVPYKADGTSNLIVEAVLSFVTELRNRTSIPVIEVDESFSTMRAREVMRDTGMKQKRRQTKGTKDAVAAAVILRDFLEELR